MPNELDMIDSVAILRSRWENVRQMRESIKVMTVRIRVVIRRSKIIRFMSRPQGGRLHPDTFTGTKKGARR